MSLKESLRRRQIRNYGYVRSDIICKPDEIKQRYQEAQNLKNSPESKQDEIRRSTLKKLDKATKYLNEQKIKNYLE